VCVSFILNFYVPVFVHTFDSFLCFPPPPPPPPSIKHDSFESVTWLIYIYNVTHLDTWRDLYICVMPPVILWGDCEMTWEGENIFYTWLTRRTIQPMHASSRPLYILNVNKYRTLCTNTQPYGVATSSRLLKIIGLFGEYRSLL